ncbi:unnamed protein product [Blepharisma stoltei]|uniref:Uncharacterized protein n=1 Tax=Blepharisma stoltei TaxID=1481888 RepID=A0AAU9IXG3_9CILI|nr:unnamed protein product [Blepharisma stoltei]
MNIRLGSYKPILKTNEIIPYINFRKSKPKGIFRHRKSKTFNALVMNLIKEKANQSPQLPKNKQDNLLSAFIRPSEQIFEKYTKKREFKKPGPIVTDTFDFDDDLNRGKLRIPLPKIKPHSSSEDLNPIIVKQKKTPNSSRIDSLSKPVSRISLSSQNTPIKDREIKIKNERVRYSSTSLLNPIGKILKSKGINLEENKEFNEILKTKLSKLHKKRLRCHEMKRNKDDILSVYLTARN